MSNVNGLSVWNRRKDFVGRTDYYGSRFLSAPQTKTSIEQALAGLAPYDVNGMMTESFIDDSVSRLNRYRTGWDWYKGNHWDNPIQDGERKSVVNFCKRIVDTAVDWTVGRGWKICTVSGNEPVAEALNLCWASNGRDILTAKMAQFSTITGDAFLYVNLQTTSEDGENLPRSQWRVRLTPLNPAHCYPVWHPEKPGELAAITVQFPQYDPEAKEEVLKTLVITPEKWELYTGDVLHSQGENLFKKVNVVHFPNMLFAESVFGQSDIHDIIPLNEEYNLVLNSVRRIIKYHGEPTTIIFGARVGDLEKGANRVWSNLPAEAKVENLALDADLNAVYQYVQELKSTILEQSFTPRIAMDPDKMSVSNMSGLAMTLMFQPLVEKTERRWKVYLESVRRTNDLIMRGLRYSGVAVDALADFPERLNDTYVETQSLLPRDYVTELDVAAKRKELGIWSTAEAIRQLSGVKDYRRLVVELSADARRKMAEQIELQRALNGQQPYLNVGLLGSEALSEDLDNLLEEPDEREEGKDDDEDDREESGMPS